MTNADDDQTTPAVPPVPPAPVTPPAASPYSPPAEAAAPAYPTAPPTYTPASPQNPYAQAPYTGSVAPARGLSVTSMILGIVGILFAGFGLLISIAAVITGHLAQRRQPYAKPFWLTGIITGYAGILFGLIVTGFFIFLFIFAATSGSSGDYYYG